MFPNDRRFDHQLAQDINEAIFIDHAGSTLAAWDKLIDIGLSPNAIRRVLLIDDNARRRRRAGVPLQAPPS